ncbi:DUF2793 domain-containing protein [Aureimonas leprariae]|nr:DUF2793 domain-containing protein [Aureimonas leprariae]
MPDDATPNFAFPYIMPSQAQKHLTHNEALRMLDAVVQVGVADRDLVAPPADAANGARFIVGAAASGAWAGQAGRIAAWQDGAWAFFAPREGWLAWVADEDALLAFDGAGWVPALGKVPIQNAPLLGVNAAADAVNRFALKSDAALFSHDDVRPGSGDMRVKLNKAAAAGTASFLFQTGYSGRAEFGTVGDDRFALKVSADGATWREALRVDNATGGLSLAAEARTAAIRPAADNTSALGGSGARWSQIWSANGVIQTSDRRDKTEIEALDPELAARLVDAVEAVTFRWIEGGRDAAEGGTVARPGRRRHAGFIAQDLRAALDRQGLDVAAWGLDDPADPTSRHWLRPDQLVALLWAALRETRQRVEALEAAAQAASSA